MNTTEIPDINSLVIRTEDEVELPASQNQANGVDDSEIIAEEQLINFEYKELEIITKQFSQRLIYTSDPDQRKLSGKIGIGRFGDVFVGFHPMYGHLVIKKAPKLSSSNPKPELAVRIFYDEVNFLSQSRHKNIVPIIGCSTDGPRLCIVLEDIDGGSLEQKLSEKMLTEKQRLNILIGAAEGLNYLHQKPSFLHNNLKTSNILLTRDCVPKLCYFGGIINYNMSTLCNNKNIVYMSPESFLGAITQKNDVYSFGIVILEVLSGLKPVMSLNSGEFISIKDYIGEVRAVNDEIKNILDPSIDKWMKGEELFTFANKCLESKRKLRPNSKELVEMLHQISSSSVSLA